LVVTRQLHHLALGPVVSTGMLAQDARRYADLTRVLSRELKARKRVKPAQKAVHPQVLRALFGWVSWRVGERDDGYTALAKRLERLQDAGVRAQVAFSGEAKGLLRWLDHQLIEASKIGVFLENRRFLQSVGVFVALVLLIDGLEGLDD